MWLAGGVACSAGLSVVALLLILLQVLAAGQPASAGDVAYRQTVEPGRERLDAGGASQLGSPQGWQTVFSGTFDGGIEPDWTVTGTGSAAAGSYVWGTSTFTYASGGRSAWCAGGAGEAGDLYTDSMDTWLVSPPIDLGGHGSELWDAEVTFAWWLDTGLAAEAMGAQSIQRVDAPPPSGDWFGWAVLTDPMDLGSGRWTYVSGTTPRWASGSLPLDGFLPASEGITTTVWIAFHFASDGEDPVGHGAFVDDVMVRVNYGHRMALPSIMKNLSPHLPDPENLVENGGFEADWGEERSHWVKIFPVDGDPYLTELGEFHTPPGWLSWFLHDPGTWDQPEVGDIRKIHVPYRVHRGEKAARLFTFFRKHDAGFMQQVDVVPGTPLTLTAYAHAWSNHPIEGHEDCGDNPRCSVGVGVGGHFLLPGDVPALNGDPWNDAIGNFGFTLGVDPTGGTDPFADTVEWGTTAYIYNDYYQVPLVRSTAEAPTATIFLRSQTLWPFKHNDAYWDEVELLGVPRTQQP
jgi:hypothetical protein